VNNPHLQSVTIENYHVGRAMFGSCGERVFVSSPRVPHYYGICLATGNLTRVRPSSINAEDSVKVCLRLITIKLASRNNF